LTDSDDLTREFMTHDGSCRDCTPKLRDVKVRTADPTALHCQYDFTGAWGGVDDLLEFKGLPRLRKTGGAHQLLLQPLESEQWKD
jgi:hypothetical protein